MCDGILTYHGKLGALVTIYFTLRYVSGIIAHRLFSIWSNECPTRHVGAIDVRLRLEAISGERRQLASPSSMRAKGAAEKEGVVG